MVPWDTILIVALYAYIAVTIIYLLLDNRETTSTLSWMLVFIFVPVLGLVAYFLFGRGMRKKTTRTLARQNLETRLQDSHEILVSQQKNEAEALHLRYPSPENRKLINLLYRNSDSILTRHNDLSVFFNGQEKFEVLLNDLMQARHYIHMEYFIWKADDLTEMVVAVLKEKAAQGVAVRVLYDALGNYLPGRYLKRLRRAGIHIYPYYNFVSPFKIHTLNYRNHRKMVIIDGATGYLGGMNMGQEYVDGGSRFPVWRDTHIRIQGEAVAVLEEVFAVSWLNTTGETIDVKAFAPRPPDTITHIQITTSGPDSQWHSIKQVYFLLISSAESSVFIQTPYFIPDASILMALKTAALSGIDVRVMLTGMLDKRVPYWAALTYIEELLMAGVRFYYYTEGFMHAKTIVVDSHCCSVGTANLDIRSFELNYEINALIYDENVAKVFEAMFMKDLASAREFTMAEYGRMHRIKKLRNSLARLFAPLL
ncbi:MAG: cardiolipin synthase [Thermodesulfobacteriota bacterium]